jgi:adenosylcobyric acid synthase
MFVGTSSDAGKSILCTAMCRILHQDGYLVAPFKSQNMSLNSAATPSGREIGRAQAVQAEACGILPNEHMNPVLLKPTSLQSSQVIVQGRVYDTRSAREYFLDSKEDIWKLVVESYQFLSLRHDIMVIEGAGSPVEMNLKPRDIVNMRVAMMADASVILVADIERGGVFASVVGTLELLPPEERARVKGIVINKFRGDKTLFDDGKRWLEDYTGIPVIGVLPYISNLNIDEEDSLGMDSQRYTLRKDEDKSETGTLRIAIVQLPQISNFTDFDPLFLEPGVHAYFCQDPEQLAGAHAVILPGTKSTISDLAWLKKNGFVDALAKMQHENVSLFGICGGYQMLGKKIYDPYHYESSISECDGIGIFDSTTTLHGEKRTVLVKGELENDFSGMDVEGYEIHMGVTNHHGKQRPFARVCEWGSTDFVQEGHISSDGRYIGTYLHGILHNNQFRLLWLNQIRASFGIPEVTESISIEDIRAKAYDRLADITREHLDIAGLYNMLGLHEVERKR